MCTLACTLTQVMMQQQHQLLLALREQPSACCLQHAASAFSMLLVWKAKLDECFFHVGCIERTERSSTSGTVGIRSIRHGGGCPTPAPSPSPAITCYSHARCDRERRRHPGCQGCGGDELEKWLVAAYDLVQKPCRVKFVPFAVD